MRKQRRRSAKLISTFVFSKGIVQFFYFLNPQYAICSCLLWPYSLVFIGPIWKPQCLFSRVAALFLNNFQAIRRQLCWLIIEDFHFVTSYSLMAIITKFEPRREKTGLRDFRPGLTQTGLYHFRSRLEARNFRFKKKRNCTIRVSKTKALISFA